MSNLLKQQLKYDNINLVQNKEKPKIFKNINDGITVISEEERENIIVQKMKESNTINISQNKKNNLNSNISESNNISKITLKKINEEVSNDEDEETFSSFIYTKTNKYIKRKKGKILVKKGILNKFLHSHDEKNNSNRKEESEQEMKEKMLMEKLNKFFGKIQKMKNSNDKKEVDDFINEEIEKRGIMERRQRFLRIKYFIDDINYIRNYDKYLKSKIKYLSPLCFSSPSVFKKC